MASLYFKVPVEPVAKGRPRFGNGHTYTPAKTKQAEELIAWYIKDHYKQEPLEGALAMKVIFHFKRPHGRKGMYHTVRPDGDNLYKLVCDALNGILYEDDNQIADGHFIKLYTDFDQEPYIEIYCESLWQRQKS